MSRENVESCRRGFEVFREGWERGHPAAAFDAGINAPDFEWIMPASFPGQQVYRGREGFAEFMRTWTEDFDEFTLRLERLIDAGGNRVVGLFHHTGTGKASGAAVELHQALVYELEGGRIARCRNFVDHASALEAVGLSE